MVESLNGFVINFLSAVNTCLFSSRARETKQQPIQKRKLSYVLWRLIKLLKMLMNSKVVIFSETQCFNTLINHNTLGYIYDYSDLCLEILTVFFCYGVA